MCTSYAYIGIDTYSYIYIHIYIGSAREARAPPQARFPWLYHCLGLLLADFNLFSGNPGCCFSSPRFDARLFFGDLGLDWHRHHGHTYILGTSTRTSFLFSRLATLMYIRGHSMCMFLCRQLFLISARHEVLFNLCA